MNETDLDLLSRYAAHKAEDAFAEVVRRHIDLVHSAALRQVRSPQLAEEVAQSTFIKLVRHARQLAPDTILTAWLYQVTRREAIDVVRREARRQLREQIATEMNAINATAADWTHIEPLLDEAMHELDDTDRTAVLLRYFENKSLREVGATLGTSENAAQKRVSRAVERLREFFAKRGVTVGASGLVVVISANAVQAAPIGLPVTIATAAALAGTPLTVTTATAVKAIALNGLQKTVVGVTLIAAVGLTIFIFMSRPGSITPSAAVPAIDDDTPETLRIATPEGAPGRLAAATTSAVETPSLTARQLYERGLVHEREKRYDEALVDLTESIELLEQGIGRWQWSPTPGAPVRDHRFDSLVAAYFSRASVFSAKKDYARAVADLSRLLEFEPKYYPARANRALHLTFLGQTNAAIAEYSVILEDPDIDFSSQLEPKEKCLARTYEYRGGIYHHSKDYAKAVRDYSESLRLDPSGGDGMIVYWRRGLCYRAAGENVRALEDANSLSQWALQWATAADSKESDRDRASTAARFGSEIFKHQAPFQLEVLAAIHAKTGDFKEAAAYQERAIKLLAPDAEDQKAAMQARLALYKAGQPLGTNF